MANALNIIEQASRKIHVLGRGQTLSAGEAQNALQALNALLGSFSIEGNLVYTQSRETFNLYGASSYTIGSGATFNTTRPTKIMAAYVTSGETDYSLKMISASDYAKIDYKTLTGIPEYFAFDGNYPTSTIFLHPVGDASYTLTLYSYKPITQFADLTTNYDLPEGVERALVYNLAVELAPEYEREPSPSVMRMAITSKRAMASQNQKYNYPTSSLDDALTFGENYNIYTGDFR